jgi:hypothetical protein
MDPLQTALAKKGPEEIAKSAESFLHVLLGEPLKEVGGILKDRISSRRHANLISIVRKAQERLADAGISPKAVPLKIIHPLLEYASLEEESGMQERWAALLASAADSMETGQVLPAFPEILKQLSKREALFLNAVYDVVFRDIRRRFPTTSTPARWTLQIDLGNWQALYHIYEQAGLSEAPAIDLTTAGEPDPKGDRDHTAFMVASDNLLRAQLLTNSPAVEGKSLLTLDDGSYFMTALGFQFVAACHPDYDKK